MGNSIDIGQLIAFRVHRIVVRVTDKLDLRLRRYRFNLAYFPLDLSERSDKD